MSIALLAALSLAAADEPAGRAAEGRAIAERYCGGCHSIERRGSSPMPSAPPLRTLHERYPIENLEESLAEGISVGHPQMPQVELTPQQIADFEAFLRSLSGKPALRQKASMRR